MIDDNNNHELLSAYLDGELTSDEQTLVERLLSEQTEYRQVYDELRALRSSLELLPRFRLHGDLSNSVIRKAERAMLRGPQAADAYNGSNGSKSKSNGDLQTSGSASAAVQSEEPVTLPIQTSWRRYAWPAVAVAACLFLMFFLPPRQGGVEIAKAPDKLPAGGLGPKPAEAEAPKEPQLAGPTAEPSNTPAGTPRDPGNTTDPKPDQIASNVRVSRGGASPVSPEVKPQPSNSAQMTSAGQKSTSYQQAMRHAAQIGKRLAGTVMVVECNVTPEALKTAALEGILVRQSIEFIGLGDKSAKPGDPDFVERSADDLDCIYVEATAAQMNAAFDEVRKRNDSFLSFFMNAAQSVFEEAKDPVAVKPAPVKNGDNAPAPSVPLNGPKAEPPASAVKVEADNPNLPSWKSHARRIRLSGEHVPLEPIYAAPSGGLLRVMFILKLADHGSANK